MKVQTTNKILQIQAWAAQVVAFKQSGKTVRQWCQENGVARKSFYYHRKRVQEEILDAIDTGNAIQMTEGDLGLLPMQMAQQSAVPSGSVSYPAQERPVFTALPLPQTKIASVTVRSGEYAVDIQNGADYTLIEQVLRVVAKL
ncbi:MAG: hypothetical protein FWG59_00525 [Betaproteobacteria bacterium]|nr:hypothetical protein [Betaproteobacteria bacterium]